MNHAPKDQTFDGEAARMVPATQPLLVGLKEFRRLLGNIGKTNGYTVMKRHTIRPVRIGGRTMIPMAEIVRVVAELTAQSEPADSERGKALAQKSVAVRRSRRGSGAT